MFERSTKDHIEEVKQNLEGVSNKLALVDRHTRDLVGDQRAITSQLMTMERRVEDYFSSLSDNIDAGLNELASAFGWGISQVVHQLELQRGELRSIVEALTTPLETEARELRRRAEFAYQNGWYDEALSDFRQVVERNYSDFIAHHLMGNIFMNKGSLPDARACYEKAAKYARPQSPSYAAYALWHIGRVLHLEGDNRGARSVTAEALQLNARLLEAQYDLSRYCALLGETQEGVGSLKTAIEADPGYCLLALSDEVFDGMKPALQDLFAELRDRAAEKAREDISRLWTYIDECNLMSGGLEFHSLTRNHHYRADNGAWADFTISRLDTNTLAKQIEEAEALVERNTYLDSRAACDVISEAVEPFRRQLDVMKKKMNLLSVVTEGELREEKESMAHFGLRDKLSGRYRETQHDIDRLSTVLRVARRGEERISTLLNGIQQHWPTQEGVGEPSAETDRVDIRRFAVRLNEVGEEKIDVIKAVHEATALGLKQSKDLVEAAPQLVKQDITEREAEAIKRKLEKAGAKAHVVRME